MPDQKESPHLFAVNKDASGWQFNRRDFITLAGAAAAGAALACGRSKEPDAPGAILGGNEDTAVFGANINEISGLDVEAPTGDELTQRLEACMTIKAHAGNIWWMENSADSRLLITSPSDGDDKLWKLPGGELIFPIAEDQQLFFAPSGSFMLLDQGDGSVDLYDTAEPSLIASFNGERVGGSSNLFSPDGTLFALMDGSSINLYELPSGDTYASIPFSDSPEALFISRDRSMVVVGNMSGEIIVYDIPGGEEQLTISAHSSSIKQLAIGAGGSRLVSFDSVNPIVKFWSLPEGDLIAEEEAGGGVIWFGDLLADGKLLLTWHDDFAKRLWSLEAGSLVQTFTEGDEVLYAPGGSKLISLQDEKPFTVYSLPTMEQLDTFERPAGVPDWPVAISPDETLFAFVRDDTTVEVHDVQNGDLVCTLSDHDLTVDIIAFSRDSSLVITAQSDGAVRLYTIGGDFVSCLVDMTELPEDVEMNQYAVTTAGQTITYTLPCGSSIPAGAVCTCNCVGGSGCSCVGYVSCSCVGHVSCSCVGDVCSCVSHVSGGGSHYWFPN